VRQEFAATRPISRTRHVLGLVLSTAQRLPPQTHHELRRMPQAWSSRWEKRESSKNSMNSDSGTFAASGKTERHGLS
jgi:hypothetical protein